MPFRSFYDDFTINERVELLPLLWPLSPLTPHVAGSALGLVWWEIFLFLLPRNRFAETMNQVVYFGFKKVI